MKTDTSAQPQSEHVRTRQSRHGGTDGGQTKAARLAKTHQDYWRGRLRKREYEDRKGKAVVIPEWQVRMKHLKREAWFNLGTPNETTASTKAREIYVFLQANGWKATLEKYKPKAEKITNPTIAEFIALYRKLVPSLEYPPSKPTLERYINCLKFVCDRAKVQRILHLDAAKVDKFKAGYLAAAKSEDRDENNARNSCNTQLRNAAAMFSRQLLPKYEAAGLKLTNPFEGARLRRTKVKAYSPIDRAIVDRIWQDSVKLRDGDPDVAPLEKKKWKRRKEGDPPKPKRKRWNVRHDWNKPHLDCYALLLLELGLGLRRNEADKAEWDWLTTGSNGRHYLEVRGTKHFTPKSKQSRTIPVEPVIFEALQVLKKDRVSPFIVPGDLPKRYRPGEEPKSIVYRCDTAHRALAVWLRERGITDDKPCHLLRKEFGSYVATAFNLFHAQRMLGHSSPQVTDAFYAGLTHMPELKHAAIRTKEAKP